jgi:hypothetical protein
MKANFDDLLFFSFLSIILTQISLNNLDAKKLFLLSKLLDKIDWMKSLFPKKQNWPVLLK